MKKQAPPVPQWNPVISTEYNRATHISVLAKHVPALGMEAAVYYAILVNKWMMNDNIEFVYPNDIQTHELGISEKKIAKLKKQLKAFGFIKTQLRGIPVKEYFTIL